MHDRPLLPPPLRRGDTIGLFCPAGPVQDLRRLERGISIISAMGFRTRIAGRYTANGSYLADSDSGRAASFHHLWADEEIGAVMAIRGGFGCLRLISHLDRGLIRKQPKMLIGFSDVTVLLNGLLLETGLVGIHGPVVTSLPGSDERSRASLFSLLTGNLPELIQPDRLEILRGGSGRGRLIGGNLTTLAHLLGTRWDSSWDNCILFLEDTNEALYRLDRLLTQLALAGRLDRLAGLLVGTFDQTGDDHIAAYRLHEALWTRIMELVPPGFPVWADFPVGHRERNIALPLGMEVGMDSEKGVLIVFPSSVELASN